MPIGTITSLSETMRTFRCDNYRHGDDECPLVRFFPSLRRRVLIGTKITVIATMNTFRCIPAIATMRGFPRIDFSSLRKLAPPGHPLHNSEKLYPRLSSPIYVHIFALPQTTPHSDRRTWKFCNLSATVSILALAFCFEARY